MVRPSEAAARRQRRFVISSDKAGAQAIRQGVRLPCESEFAWEGAFIQMMDGPQFLFDRSSPNRLPAPCVRPSGGRAPTRLPKDVVAVAVPARRRSRPSRTVPRRRRAAPPPAARAMVRMVEMSGPCAPSVTPANQAIDRRAVAALAVDQHQRVVVGEVADAGRTHERGRVADRMRGDVSTSCGLSSPSFQVERRHALAGRMGS